MVPQKLQIYNKYTIGEMKLRYRLQLNRRLMHVSTHLKKKVPFKIIVLHFSNYYKSSIVIKGHLILIFFL